jgi:membrane-associated protein
VTYISVGAFAAVSYRQLEGQLSWAGILFVGIILVALVLIYLLRKAIERREARHMGPQ